MIPTSGLRAACTTRISQRAGGVDAFLIGTRAARPDARCARRAASYPFVAALADLAADVRAILGRTRRSPMRPTGTEYFGHHPPDGSGDVYFHLDPLWASPDIDFVGIDN